MTWNAEETKVPSEIGYIVFVFTDNDGTPANHIITGNVQILDAKGDVFGFWNGDVEPHLSAAQKSGLIDFLAAMRAKAEDELLP